MTDNRTYSTRKESRPYITKDGSEIRELMHPGVHGNNTQSLAEATIFPGGGTRLYKHHYSEELYHVLFGSGRMTLGEREFSVAARDTICIDPGMAHRIDNTGDQDLVILCCCSPPYAHGDTELIPDAG